MWRAIPPPGFRALGCLVCAGHERPSYDAIRCVRAELCDALPAPIEKHRPSPVWTEVGATMKLGDSAVSVWAADPAISTICVVRGYSRQASAGEFHRLARMALLGASVGEGGGGGSLSMQARLGDLSVRLHDDATQYKVPVLGFSVRGLQVSSALASA